MRHTKILCTLGPSSSDYKTIKKMIEAGMDAVRLNFSHGDYNFHKEIVEKVRRASEEMKKPIAIVQDLAGPKLRIGRFKDKKVILKKGEEFILTTKEIEGDEKRVSVSYKDLPSELKKGDTVLLADGTIKLEVKELKEEEIVTEVKEGGELSDHKGINLPYIDIKLRAPTEKDKRDLEFGKSLGVDYILLSFVQSGEDVKVAKQLAGDIPVIAKIEKPVAVENLSEIIEVSDGVMVARGDLGVEIGIERVPLIQKRIIEETNKRGKLAITATQMLESMVFSHQPTRAEITDIATAVLDGSDALMLSEETAIGKYPIKAIEVMDRTIREVESSPMFKLFTHPPLLKEGSFTNAIAIGAVEMVRKLELDAIVSYTISGLTVKYISEYRPLCPILALTPKKETYHNLSLHWGVIPILLEHSLETTEEMINYAKERLVEFGIVKKGDRVVITAGYERHEKGQTNMLILEKI